jgi:hypothetical protein
MLLVVKVLTHARDERASPLLFPTRDNKAKLLRKRGTNKKKPGERGEAWAVKIQSGLAVSSPKCRLWSPSQVDVPPIFVLALCM